jgi:RHS repeat-associated protein
VPDDGSLTAGDIRDKGGRLIRRRVQGRIQNLGYDGRNRLTRWDWDGSAGTSCSYDYDHAGRRILTRETVGGATKVTRYVYDGADVCAEYEDSDNDGDVDRTRVYWLLPGMDRRIGFAETVNNTTTFYYYLTDHVGTVLRIVKEDGTVVNQYDYDAFGRVRINSDKTFEGVENRYLFQGCEWDKNGGFYYFRNRIYLPERGEFASPDMNLGRGILGELDGMATLTFCGGDPVNCVDPTGLEPVTITAAAVTLAARYILIQGGISVLETGVEYGFHEWLGDEKEEFNFKATFGKNFAINCLTAGMGGKANKAYSISSRVFRYMTRQGVEVAGDTAVDVLAYDRNLDESLARNSISSIAGEEIGRGVGWAWKKGSKRFSRGSSGTVFDGIAEKLDDPPCGPRKDLVTSPSSTAGAGGAAESQGRIVYRALNAKDSVRLKAGLGLEAKNPAGTWSVGEHVELGTGKASWANDPWIATTPNLDVARGFDGGRGIVAIDLSKVSSAQSKAWELYPRVNGKAGIPYHYSIWQQETSVYQDIPLEAILGFVK